MVKKNVNLFVDPKKVRVETNIRKKSGNVGLEYDNDVTNDEDYCRKIFETNGYHSTDRPFAASMINVSEKKVTPIYNTKPY